MTFFYTDKPSKGPAMADVTVVKIFHLTQHRYLLIETCFSLGTLSVGKGRQTLSQATVTKWLFLVWTIDWN